MLRGTLPSHKRPSPTINRTTLALRMLGGLSTCQNPASPASVTGTPGMQHGRSPSLSQTSRHTARVMLVKRGMDVRNPGA